MRRTFDPELLNRVVNHPAVRPWLGGGGAIDVTPLLDNHANYALVGDGGGFVFIDKGGGVYEAHSQFLPHTTDNVRACAAEALRFMFTETPCTRITSMLPDGNVVAKRFSNSMGFTPTHRDEAAWPTADGLVGLTHVALDCATWAEMKEAA